MGRSTKTRSLAISCDRPATGSDAVSQYAPPVRDVFASRDRVPDAYRWPEGARA